MAKSYTYSFKSGIINFNVLVTPNESVTLEWDDGNTKTFKVGDPACYIGTEKFNGFIEKIGPKTVTIKNYFIHRIGIKAFTYANF